MKIKNEIEFIGTAKKAFVSRSYFKLLTDKMEQNTCKKKRG